MRHLHTGFHRGGARRCSIANPTPLKKQIRLWLANNLCRCTGYDKIIRAVQKAAAQMQEVKA